MFRPFRPAFENLEKREVFSAGPLALAAAQPEGVIHPFSDFAIKSNATLPTSVANYNGGAIHFGSQAIGSPNVVPVSSNSNAETDADSDGADFLAWQRQAQPADQTAAADFDNDGVVDGADLLVWLRQAQPADQTAPSAIWLEGTYRNYQQPAAPESQPTAIVVSDPDDADNGLTAATGSVPTAFMEGGVAEGTRASKAAPGAGPSAITGSYNPSTGVLTAVPASHPTAAADFDNDGDVDGADFLAARSAAQFAPHFHTQGSLGNGDGTFQSQGMHEEEDANDVNSLTARAHDRFFEALGMASQRSMKQNYDMTLAQPWQ